MPTVACEAEIKALADGTTSVLGQATAILDQASRMAPWTSTTLAEGMPMALSYEVAIGHE